MAKPKATKNKAQDVEQTKQKKLLADYGTSQLQREALIFQLKEIDRQQNQIKAELAKEGSK